MAVLQCIQGLSTRAKNIETVQAEHNCEAESGNGRMQQLTHWWTRRPLRCRLGPLSEPKNSWWLYGTGSCYNTWSCTSNTFEKSSLPSSPHQALYSKTVFLLSVPHQTSSPPMSWDLIVRKHTILYAQSPYNIQGNFARPLGHFLVQ